MQELSELYTFLARKPKFSFISLADNPKRIYQTVNKDLKGL